MRKLFHKKHTTPAEFIADEVGELKKEYGRFRRFTDENSLLMGTLVLGIAALVVINTLFWVEVTKQNESKLRAAAVSAATTHVTKTLDPTFNSAFEASVRDVTINSAEDPAFGVEEGKTMLIMSFTITNRTSTAKPFIPVNQLFVRTPEGEYSALHASMHVKNPIAAQDLAPGATATGQISFAVPKKADTLLLYVDTSWDNTTPLVIDVLH